VGKGTDFGKGVWWARTGQNNQAGSAHDRAAWSDQLLAWAEWSEAWGRFTNKRSRDKNKEVLEEPRPMSTGFHGGPIFEDLYPFSQQYDPDFETVVMILLDTHGDCTSRSCVSANARCGNGAGQDGRDMSSMDCPRDTGLDQETEDLVWLRARRFAAFVVKHWLWPVGSTAHHAGACGAAIATFRLVTAQLLRGGPAVKDLYLNTLTIPAVEVEQTAFAAVEFCEAAMASADALHEAAAARPNGLPASAAVVGVHHYYTRILKVRGMIVFNGSNQLTSNGSNQLLKLEQRGSQRVVDMALAEPVCLDEAGGDMGYGDNSRVSNPGANAQAQTRSAKLVNVCQQFLDGKCSLAPLLVYGGDHRYSQGTPRRLVGTSDSFPLRAGRSAACGSTSK
jgi:hypothetical protein